MIDVSPHKLSSCSMCGEHINCAFCGNNCCNGGTGNLSDGSECGCEDAYRVQHLYFKDQAWIMAELQREHNS